MLEYPLKVLTKDGQTTVLQDKLGEFEYCGLGVNSADLESQSFVCEIKKHYSAYD